MNERFRKTVNTWSRQLCCVRMNKICEPDSQYFSRSNEDLTKLSFKHMSELLNKDDFLYSLNRFRWVHRGKKIAGLKEIVGRFESIGMTHADFA